MRDAWLRAMERMKQASEWAGLNTSRGRVLTIITCVVAGFMMATSAVASRDGDLRPSRNTEMVGLVRAQADHNEELNQRVEALRAQVDALTKDTTGEPKPVDAKLELAAAKVALQGPGVRVTLTDAPLSVQPTGIAEDLLVVHQQDIQAAVNALWAGGAEAMTIQGQRINSTTGIKCVGNTVVLEGMPYAPPYVIEAIGDTDGMLRALDESPYLQTYREYVDAYRLGYAVDVVAEIKVPAHRGSLDLKYARPID